MFETEFERMLREYRDAIPIRSRFSGLVKDFFPGQQMQVNLLLSAYDLGIAQEMEKTDRISQAFAYRFVKRMVEEYGVSRANADWTISVWCVCYGQKLLQKPCEIKISSGKNAAAPAIQGEKSGTQYGDLFRYEPSAMGDGLAVTGFAGDGSHMIIFQNVSQNQPVVEIQAEAFAGSQVEEVILTEGYRRIGKGAFRQCLALKQIILPVSLRELGDSALEGCTNLKNLTFPPMLSQIGTSALAQTGLKTLQIPQSVYWIGEGAFSACERLEEAVIPENIKEIPAKLFQDCRCLKKGKLHEQLRAIGDFAFAGCSSLETLNIPDSVTEIGEHAFAGVSGDFLLTCGIGSYTESYAQKNKMKYQLV